MADASKSSFPDTRWTLVVSAQDQDSPKGSAALGELCELYWSPIYFYVRRRGHSPEDSEDLTQKFFHRMLEKRRFLIADECRGRLRSFLLTSLKHFLSDEWDRSQALKRGGAVQILSIDQRAAEECYQIEPRDNLSPDVLYEKQWANTIMAQILATLRQEQVEAGNEAIFESLKDHLGWNAGESTYNVPAKELGLSENAIRLRVMRLRRRYGELLRACIAETVSSEEELTREMEYLFNIIRA
jgi:RNA polymerase sigma-70 factor (ECF subfamily)